MVGYRAFVARHATSMGLSGFARNLPDGSVEVQAFGEESFLRQLVDHLHIGPALATVEDVEWVMDDAAPDHQGFRVL